MSQEVRPTLNGEELKEIKQLKVLKEFESLSVQIHLNVMKFTRHLLTSKEDQRNSLFIDAQDLTSRAVVETAMLMAEGNQSKAARMLGLSRSTIRQYLYRYFGRKDIGAKFSKRKRSEKID